MALALSVRKGESIHVGEHTVVVHDILSHIHVIVMTDDGRSHDVVPDKMVEVYDDIFMSLGGTTSFMECRIAIEAPKSILILTDKNWVKKHGAEGRDS